MEDASIAARFIGPGLLITLGTGIAYGLVYSYERGFANRLCLPGPFIQVSPASLIATSIIVILLLTAISWLLLLLPASWLSTPKALARATIATCRRRRTSGVGSLVTPLVTPSVFPISPASKNKGF
jgi:hypothetical protein